MALPDDDGTQAAEVALFKRKRRLRLGAYALLAALGLTVGLLFWVNLFPEITTMEQDLERVQQCKVDQASVSYDPQGRVEGKTSRGRPHQRPAYQGQTNLLVLDDVPIAVSVHSHHLDPVVDRCLVRARGL